MARVTLAPRRLPLVPPGRYRLRAATSALVTEPAYGGSPADPSRSWIGGTSADRHADASRAPPSRASTGTCRPRRCWPPIPTPRRYPWVVDRTPLGVWPVRGRAPERVVRITYAVVVLTAVASAALLLWLAAGDGGGSRSYRGIEASCISRFEDGGGDTSTCDRVSAGAQANVLGQLVLAVGGGVLALRLRQPLVWLRATVAVSVAVAAICYVFMRSWQFGLDQPLL
jgi:hypothetical protein